jgi:hypothetical protein
MIKLPEFVEFRYSELEWDQIKSVVPDALRRKFDLNRRIGHLPKLDCFLRVSVHSGTPWRFSLDDWRKTCFRICTTAFACC